MDMDNLFEEVKRKPKPVRVFLHRAKKSTIENKNIVVEKNRVIVELPDDFEYENIYELIGKKFKYKIGDGVTKYNDLPYEGEIPVAFYV